MATEKIGSQPQATTAANQQWQPEYHGPGPSLNPDTSNPMIMAQGAPARTLPTQKQHNWAGGDEDESTIRQSWVGVEHSRGLNAPAPIREKRSNSMGTGRAPSMIARASSTVKGHIVATIGEFLGTTAFLFFAFAGTQVANDTPSGSLGIGPHPMVLQYIALCFGFSLMVNVWVFYRISGGLFNPAVTLAMLLTGAIPLIRAIILFLAQILGAILASGLVVALFPPALNVNTTLQNGTSLARGFFIEAFLTMELVFAILMLAKEKHKATFMAPVGIGLALFIAELVGVYYTGGSLNPARSFGPAVVTATFDSNHWIYWFGPALGSLGAVGLYKLILIFNYELGNPGQDEESEEAAAEAAEVAKARDEEEAV